MFLPNRIALVTGAGSGIGQAICRILARDGVSVVAADINKESAKKTLETLKDSKNSLALELNVSDSSSVKETFESITKHYGKVPTLLAQAAGITRDNFIHKLEEKQFIDVFNVNLKGTFLVQKEFLSHFKSSENGGSASVVNISSVVAKHGNMGQSNYAASKAGVEAFTKSSAKEFGKEGIRVNCVVPGFVETPMVDTVPDNIKSLILFATPLKRFGKPEEVAEVVSFLLSDRSSFMTGAMVEVTGGLSM